MAKATEIGGRWLCDILDDMRTCHKTHNYSYLLSLVEEAQYRANRMKDRLSRVESFERKEKEYLKLKEEIKALQKKKEDLES